VCDLNEKTNYLDQQVGDWSWHMSLTSEISG
jgi:hypothetical protein